MHTIHFLALGAILVLADLFLASAAAQEKVTPKALQIAEALEKLLPEYEAAADRLDQALQPFLGSADPKVAVAADSTLLQLRSIRSIRKIIAEQPNYLIYHIGTGHLARWKEGAEYFLECARAGTDPFAGMTAGVRPYRSKIDGELLLYRYTLPRDYDPAKKYPVRIQLHAGAGFLWLAGWVTGKPDNSPRAAGAEGFIQITPAGRQHVGMGEVAILEALADARKHYPIDDERIIIGGASWGGTGGFHFGTLLPDRFAAAYSLTGGGNYSVPVGNGRFDAYLLGDNLSALAFLLWDTPGDGHYRANHAFADGLRARAAQYSGSYPHLELTDPKGGHGIIDRKLQDEGWAWMAKQVRTRYPRRVIYKSYCLRYDGAYWAYLDTVIDPTQPARIEAEVADEGRCRVVVENADRFHLDLAPPLVGGADKLTVSINGGTPLTVSGRGTVYFCKAGGGWSIAAERYPAGPIKKHGVSGPIQDVFMDHPVLMVHGTRAPGAMTQTLDRIVTRLISSGDGSGILRSGFERKADDRVTDADLATKNLLLVGTPQQNRLVARIAAKLPVTFLDDGVRLNGKDYRGPGVGLTLVYPNPLNPERYVLLVPEDYAGERVWDYPDYLVLRAPAGGKGRPAVLAKGSFDAQWQLR